MENIPAVLPLAKKHGAFVFSIGAMQKKLLDVLRKGLERRERRYEIVGE
jgi:hypothetical protein